MNQNTWENILLWDVKLNLYGVIQKIEKLKNLKKI